MADTQSLWNKYWAVEDEMRKVDDEYELLMLQKEVELAKLRIKKLGIEQQIIKTRLAEKEQQGMM